VRYLLRVVREAASKVPQPIRRAVRPFVPGKALLFRVFAGPDARIAPEMRVRRIPLARPAKKVATRYSMVVPFYNVGRYVDDFFYSIFAQTVDTECLEIIAVDDGSTDDTANGIDAWSRRFPGRIKYIYQENQGQAIARNTGLAYATGEWIAFPDPDDFLSLNYLAAVDAEIEREPRLSMISCNMIFCREPGQRISNGHPLRFRYDRLRTTCHASDLRDHIQLSAAQAWFRRELIDKYDLRFDPRVVPTFEDGHFVNRYLLLNPKSKVSFLKKPIYYYRKRDDGSSTLDGSHASPSWYLDALRYGGLDLLRCARELTGAVPRFIQRTLLYDAIWRFHHLVDHPERNILSNAQEEEFFGLLQALFDGIDRTTLNTFELAKCSEEHKVALLGLFKSAKRPVTVVYSRAYDEAKELLQVSYLSTDPKPNAVAYVDEKLTPLRHFSRRRTAFLRRTFFYEHFFWIAASRNSSVSVRVEDELASLKVGGTHYGANARVNRLVDALRRRVNIESLPDDVIQLRRAAVSKEARERYGGCWLLMDRVDRADDNAEHLYRYLVSIGKGDKTFFVLHRDSVDWKRLEAEGFKLLSFGSREHAIALINASFLISSHADQTILWPMPRNQIGDLAKYRMVFLQHGIISQDLSKWLNTKEFARLFTATTDEYRSIIAATSDYKFSEKEVVLTGLCRHDRLASLPSSRSTVLIMPTWRKPLSGPADDKLRRTRSEQFTSSQYFVTWRSLLHSPSLKRLVDQHGLNLVFCPHPNVVPYLPDFEIPSWVRVATDRVGSVQNLFAEAATLITDYSSVIFELAYLDKPVIHYHFDGGEIFSGGHVYERGYFDFDRDGLGPVCTTQEDLLDQLEVVLSGKEAPRYCERRRAIFPYRDGKCCKRVYDSILELDAPQSEPRIVLKSYTRIPNAGDAASAFILSRLTDARIETSSVERLTEPNLISLGSLLHWSDSRSVVWGTGVLSDEHRIGATPERVFAVRGPLSRKRLLDVGAACPDLFGDPGILISDVYPRRIVGQTSLGIIPHYMDREEPFVVEAIKFGAKLIDVGQPLEEYLDALCKCDCILTSSLHGIVFAHSYGIPAAWVKLSDRVVGGSVKFRDYYASVGFNEADIPNLSGSDSVQHAVKAASLPRAEIDRAALKVALAAAYQYIFDAAP
jgi:glycosyltransferase involved in cell wall biosynthesis